MKNKFKMLCLAGLLSTMYNNNLQAATSYDAKLQDLQKQIDELKKVNNSSALSLLDGLDIGGRIHVNGTWNEDGGSDLSVKRARLTVNKVMNNWELQLQADFASNGVYLEENYLAYYFNDNSSIKIGQSLIPGFMEREKTTDDMSAILWNSEERLGWIPSYLIGVNYAYRSDDLGVSLGVYGNGVDNEGKVDNYVNYNTAGRVWYSPINTDEAVVMLGLNSMYQSMKGESSTGEYLYSQYAVSKQFNVGIELFLQYNSVYLASEYLNASFEFDNAPSSSYKTTDAFSTEFVWNITGEKTYYDGWYGVYGGVDVANPISKGGLGAFQFVARYSFADGKDNYLLGTEDYTLGINWLPESNVKFLLGYSKIKDTDYAGNEDKYDLYQVEARYAF